MFRNQTRIRQVICTLVETWDAKKSSSSLFWGDAGGIPHPSIHSWNEGTEFYRLIAWMHFFSNALILKRLCSVFKLKMYWFFFWSISFPNKFIQCPTDDMPFFMKFIHISCIPGGSAKNFEQSQISGLGTPECHSAAGHNSNLWPALQDYSQANLFSWFFLLHAGIMTSVRKDSEGTTSSPHHSTTSSISKPEKEIFTTW